MVVCVVATGSSQSLADVARAEAARRKALGNSGAKVYTNDGLSDAGRATTSVTAPGAATAKSETPARGGSAPAPAADEPETGPIPIDPPKDEKYWRNRISQARTALQRSQAFIEALQSHINGLYAEFTAMGDPVQRAAIENKRNEAMAEQNRLKADIARQTNEIAAIEDEARRASVPAGWLR
jgi:hypothetical protein